jgi:hypothetical protein
MKKISPRVKALNKNPRKLKTKHLEIKLADAIHSLRAIDSAIAKGHHAYGGNIHAVRKTLRTLIPKYEAEHDRRGINYVPYQL